MKNETKENFLLQKCGGPIIPVFQTNDILKISVYSNETVNLLHVGGFENIWIKCINSTNLCKLIDSQTFLKFKLGQTC